MAQIAVGMALVVVPLREELGWRRWSAVAVGFVGVLIMIRPGLQTLGAGHHLLDAHHPARPRGVVGGLSHPHQIGRAHV